MKHSTESNLLECTNKWTESIDQKFLIKVLYTDFSKAFDVVSGPKLLYKLNKYGINGKLYECIESFLTDRSQSVKVGLAVSSSRKLLSGVVQGSVLGPLLFILFINDITNTLKSDVSAKLFADDFKSFSINDYRVNSKCIQNVLDTVKVWSDIWQMPLSI